jgi:hypothetical protein
MPFGNSVLLYSPKFAADGIEGSVLCTLYKALMDVKSRRVGQITTTTVVLVNCIWMSLMLNRDTCL